MNVRFWPIADITLGRRRVPVLMSAFDPKRPLAVDPDDMVTIRQHGSREELFDIAHFLADIDRFVPPDAWHVTVECCVGERATEIEQITASGRLMSDADFRSIYSGVHQTIDGRFTGLRDEERLFELVAVDSSFWEVTGPLSFESHMLST